MSVLASKNLSTKNAPGQLLAKLIANQANKYRHQILSVGTTMIVVGHAQPSLAIGLFQPTQQALSCMFAGGPGGVASPLLTGLPVVLSVAITILLFGYFISAGVKVVNALGEGQEVTQLIQQPLGVFLVTLVLYIVQSILFGSAAVC
ncbi:hypothetical protein [Anabaena sp. CCY 0017]|uniref:hypothetical protein n=1 Tax=Anabaena sp. CCY 0017 TaxID=3103866 RepID=UPI0039C6FA5F